MTVIVEYYGYTFVKNCVSLHFSSQEHVNL